MIKMRTKINDFENRKPTKKINETKSWYSKRSIKLISLQQNYLRKQERGYKLLTLEMKKEKIGTDIEIKRIIKNSMNTYLPTNLIT